MSDDSMVSAMVRQAMSLSPSVREQYRWMLVWDSLANCDVGWLVLRRGCSDRMGQYQWRDWNRNVAVVVGTEGQGTSGDRERALDRSVVGRSAVEEVGVVIQEESEVKSKDDNRLQFGRDATTSYSDLFQSNNNSVESESDLEETIIEEIIDDLDTTNNNSVESESDLEEIIIDDLDTTREDENKDMWCEKCSTYFEPLVFNIHVCVNDFKVVISNSTENNQIMKAKLFRYSLKHPCRFSCQVCGKKLRTLSGLLFHLEGSHSVKRYHCPFCEKSFSLKHSLKTHVITAHKTNLLTTERKSNPRIDSFEKEGDRVLCLICGKLLGSECSLKLHMEGIHGKRSQCPMCEKAFSLRQTLKRHVKKVHNTSLLPTGRKDKTFSRRTKTKSASSRLSTTSNSYPSSQSDSCSSNSSDFSNSSIQPADVEQLDKMLGIKPRYPCEVCAKKVINIEGHMKRMHGEKNINIPAPAPAVVNVPITSQKSKYELIREEIIAERNSQLKAMGFFEDFSALRSEMDTKKPSKEPKN